MARERLSPVVRLRQGDGGRDQYGDAVPGPVVETSLPPCRFAPGGSSEPVRPGEAAVISSPTAYWRGQWPDVLASDLLRVDGVTYRVDGAPSCWPLGTVVTLATVTDPTQTGGL